MERKEGQCPAVMYHAAQINELGAKLDPELWSLGPQTLCYGSFDI